MPPTSTPTSTPALPRTLTNARETFLAAMQRETPGTDLPRYTEVLDALLAWSAARADRIGFRVESGARDVLSFERTGGGTSGVLWSVQSVRANAPMLEIAPPNGRSLSPARRELVLTTLNAHSRTPLVEGDRLRIGFGALKNTTARAAVLALLDTLLTPEPD